MRVNQSVAQLNSYLHGEISAVEAYRRALATINGDAAKRALEQCEQSHEQRVQMLSRRISSMGGTPAESSMPWKVAAQEEPALITELEKFESQELADYQREMVALDSESRRFLESTILPEAKKAHDEIEKLVRTMH